ncbi:type I-E CRISPR-associated endoribonuclease Cas2e [Paucibacter sp. XJ19-41]|uniref:type I-E CRISPR-associated endoribonuclease Cas2e n=1 Tax=Paucibacter sp. XJ19-41 TaxID=2927824 RepID=UPI00234A6D7F|nr:type I-E CRISPR-associated endoribonuclease Cas2e [Paucibacter sp. XJ19-41]MDC6166467.1 type I-E CRISPR-associated endoribonuclease Cas2e [Paucibacter sp. XJ19-41]
MALVMVTTRDVADRFRGFLASVMLEVAPGVFVSPRMNPGARERVWGVMRDWHGQEPRGSLVMVWRDLNATGGVGLAQLGNPPRELVEADGMWLTRRSKPPKAL